MASKETGKRYSEQDVLNQTLVAFGQGTGCVRVSSGACRELVGLMTPIVEARDLTAKWEDIAVQMLERIRTIGRVAVNLMLDEGRVYIEEKDVAVAFRRVQLGSKTGDCNFRGGAGP